MGSKISKARLLLVLAATTAAPLAALACGAAHPAADDGIGTANYLRTGPCSTEGATAPCHAATGRTGSVVSCISGTQTCANGAWTGCGGESASFTSIDLGGALQGGQAGIGIRAVTAGDASADAGACAADPCNADCMGIDVDADTLRPDGGVSSATVQGDTNQFGSFPTAKQGAMATTCTVGSPPGDYNVCSYDYCCAPTGGDGTTGTCAAWFDDAGASRCLPAAGVDFTTGIGCMDANGNVQIPVCNRGTSDATSGTLLLAGYPANPNTAGSSAICNNPGTSSPQEGCTIDLSVKPLKKGACLGIDVTKAAAGLVPGIKCQSASDFSNGNRTTMVNPPSTTFSKLGNLGSGSYTQLAETDRCNDYSFVFTQIASCGSYNGLPPPTTTTYDYKASCPVGRRAQWSALGWRATTPADSEIQWSVQTAPLAGDGGAGAFGSAVAAGDVKSDGSADPSSCAIGGGTSGCPKSLATLLGKDAWNPVLRLSVTEISTSAVPWVTSWQLTYSCVSYE